MPSSPLLWMIDPSIVGEASRIETPSFALDSMVELRIDTFAE